MVNEATPPGLSWSKSRWVPLLQSRESPDAITGFTVSAIVARHAIERTRNLDGLFSLQFRFRLSTRQFPMAMPFDMTAPAKQFSGRILGMFHALGRISLPGLAERRQHGTSGERFRR
jgi:hypothetical protein